jgi:hydrogenase-4 component H
MNIFNVLSQNLGRGSRTRTPDNSVPYPTGYRGRIQHDLTLCTACGTCAYVCSPGAITTDDSDPEVVNWNYTEDRCTFCSFCVTYCPTQALSIEAASPSLLSERAEHYISHFIALQPCEKCGRPVRAIPDVTLIRLYGDPLPEEIAAARGLCEQCRQRVTGERFVTALVGRGRRGDHGY